MPGEDVPPAATPPLAPRKRRWHVPWWLQLFISVALISLSIMLLLPQLPEGERAVDALRDLSLPVMLTGLVLEAASLIAYTAMTRLIFRAPGIRFRTLLRIDLTVTGLSHAVPAGGPTAAALRLRLLRLAGLNRSEAISGEAVQATASDLLLGCLFLIGLVLLIIGGGDTALYTVVAIVVCAALISAAIFALLLLRPSERLAGWVHVLTRHVPRMRSRALTRVVQAVTARLSDLAHHPSRSSLVLMCAALNWTLDAAVLWVMLAGVGEHLGLGPLLTVYGLGNIFAILPLTPGGLGVVEGVMIPSLLGFGVPQASALVAVLGWRLWQFWLPIPVAGLSYASLRLGDFRRTRSIPKAIEKPPLPRC
jgi:uncharacterized protein (TIRG00374 family)